jgi:uncharacterized protein (DUF736 family)
MAYEQRNNTGTLGKNKNKTDEKHPDHRGRVIIDGVEYWVSAWIKVNGSTGERFFSLAFSKKEDSDAAPKSAPQSSTDFDEDIPFS